MFEQQHQDDDDERYRVLEFERDVTAAEVLDDADQESASDGLSRSITGATSAAPEYEASGRSRSPSVFWRVKKSCRLM